jgi:hypothetical protein
MGEDLLVNDCCIGGCHAGEAGEDHDADAQKAAEEHRGDGLRDKVLASGVDG